MITFCLQSSSIRDDPHEINGEVLKDGRIVGMSCSCKAGSCKPYTQQYTLLLLFFGGNSIFIN